MINEPKPNRQKKPRSQSDKLGKNQIAWLRKEINAFDPAWRSVQKADAHKNEARSKLGLTPEDRVPGIDDEKEKA